MATTWDGQAAPSGPDPTGNHRARRRAAAESVAQRADACKRSWVDLNGYGGAGCAHRDEHGGCVCIHIHRLVVPLHKAPDALPRAATGGCDSASGGARRLAAGPQRPNSGGRGAETRRRRAGRCPCRSSSNSRSSSAAFRQQRVCGLGVGRNDVSPVADSVPREDELIELHVFGKSVVLTEARRPEGESESRRRLPRAPRRGLLAVGVAVSAALYVSHVHLRRRGWIAGERRRRVVPETPHALNDGSGLVRWLPGR